MKKNKMMRLASAMMVMTLMTTSVISGTFAKYVTQDSAEDSARVAKFGVVVTADGSLFEKSYKHAPEEDANKATVISGDSQDVVAPGTYKLDDTLKFSITGKPEVAVKVTFSVANEKDVFLAAGEYENLTTGNADDKTTITDIYYPVKYTLWDVDAGTGTATAIDGLTDVTLATIVAALEDTGADAKFSKSWPAGTDLTDKYGDYKLTWAWAFGTEGVPQGNDEADTILGDLAAGSPAAGLNGATLTEGTNYNLSTGLTLEIRVEQID